MAKHQPRRIPKVALNVVEKLPDGTWMAYQLYASLKIPLLGHRRHGEFTETPARSMQEAFDRMYKEYYE